MFPRLPEFMLQLKSTSIGILNGRSAILWIILVGTYHLAGEETSAIATAQNNSDRSPVGLVINEEADWLATANETSKQCLTPSREYGRIARRDEVWRSPR